MKKFYTVLAILFATCVSHGAGCQVSDYFCVSQSESKPDCFAVTFGFDAPEGRPPIELVMYIPQLRLAQALNKDPRDILVYQSGSPESRKRFLDEMFSVLGDKPADEFITRHDTAYESGIVFTVWEPSPGKKMESISVCSKPDLPLGITFGDFIEIIPTIVDTIFESWDNILHDNKAFSQLMLCSGVVATIDKNMKRITIDTMRVVFPEEFSNIPPEQLEAMDHKLVTSHRDTLLRENPDKKDSYFNLFNYTLYQRFMKEKPLGRGNLMVRYIDRRELESTLEDPSLKEIMDQIVALSNKD